MNKIVNVDFRTAAQAAQDDPADLDMARRRFAPYARLPLSREAEVTLLKIAQKEAEIGKLAGEIRWLRLALETIS